MCPLLWVFISQGICVGVGSKLASKSYAGQGQTHSRRHKTHSELALSTPSCGEVGQLMMIDEYPSASADTSSYSTELSAAQMVQPCDQLSTVKCLLIPYACTGICSGSLWDIFQILPSSATEWAGLINILKNWVNNCSKSPSVLVQH